MEQYLGYVSNDLPVSGEFDGVDSKHDAEIWFLPSITLDNGVKFGVNIQLEGDGNLGTSDTIDESFLFIKGSFGEVILGSENSAGYKMTYAAPDVTFLNVNSGSLTFFVPFSGSVAGTSFGSDVFRRTLGTTYLENVGNNDANRFTYFTPRFSGLQLGVSYARDGLQDSNEQIDTNADGVLNNIFDVGANYVNTFGDFNIAASTRYGIADDNSGADPQIWSAGLNLGYAGVTIGGSYAEQTGTNSTRRNGESWDAGISYVTGPWGFSFTYFDGVNQDNENVGRNDDEELQQYLIGVSYALATGVALNAYGAYVDFDEDLSDGGVGNGDDLDAWVVGTGIRVDF